MELKNVDIVFYTTAFLVPGFILNWTLSMLVPRRMEDPKLAFLRFLTLSALNYSIWSWLILLLFTGRYFSAHPWVSAALWFLVVCVSPFAIGIGTGIFLQNDGPSRVFQSRLLRWLRARPIGPIATAWDRRFGSLSKGLYVLITLADDRQIAGKYGRESYVSSDHDQRDVFLQERYIVDEKGSWRIVPRTAGIWIRGDQIKYIDFISG